MEISESIYEGVSETYYKQSTRVDVTHAGHRRKKRGEYTSPHTYSTTSESAGKLRKIYLDHP